VADKKILVELDMDTAKAVLGAEKFEKALKKNAAGAQNVVQRFEQMNATLGKVLTGFGALTVITAIPASLDILTGGAFRRWMDAMKESITRSSKARAAYTRYVESLREGQPEIAGTIPLQERLNEILGKMPPAIEQTIKRIEELDEAYKGARAQAEAISSTFHRNAQVMATLREKAAEANAQLADIEALREAEIANLRVATAQEKIIATTEAERKQLDDLVTSFTTFERGTRESELAAKGLATVFVRLNKEGRDIPPVLEEQIKTLKELGLAQRVLDPEAEARRKRAEEEQKRHIEGRLAAETRLQEELAKLTLAPIELELRAHEIQLENFRKFTDDRVAIAKFEADQRRIFLFNLGEMQRAQAEKELADRERAEEEILSRRRAAADEVFNIQQAQLDRQIALDDQTLEMQLALNERKFQLQIEAENQRFERLQEEHAATEEEVLLHNERLNVIQQEQMDREREMRSVALEENALVLEEFQAGIESTLEQGMGQFLEAIVIDTENAMEVARGFMKSMVSLVVGSLIKIIVQRLILAKLTAAIEKKKSKATLSARSSETFAGQFAAMSGAPFPINLTAPAIAASMTAAMTAGAAAAQAAGGAIAGGVATQRGGEIPVVPGLPTRGDVIPTLTEPGEIVTPRPFAEEFRGFSRFLEEFGRGGGAEEGPRQINVTMSNNTFVGGDRSTLEEASIIIGEVLDEAERDQRFRRTRRAA